MKVLLLSVLFCTLSISSPLHKSVIAVDEDTVHTLVDEGLNINSLDKYFKTPLHYAASIGRYSLVKYLVDSGANVHIKDKNHKTPLVYAIEKNRIKVIIYLSKMANIQELQKDEQFFEAAKQGDMDYVAYALSRSDINRVNADGKTALHVASESGQFDIVAFLLNLGANRELLDYDGRTALNYAKLSGNKKLYELLLRYKNDTTKF
ncbi:ankyrin repeat domain-containing protein [Sulfurimonas sp. MAG313]|nr:ankyrin repeat domain-containing protein [Sulfurimonas sp. MAG313]MDF1881027.1 ankyrin repeat domain-containing protein [Sulfurimonas sp. MAG313]